MTPLPKTKATLLRNPDSDGEGMTGGTSMFSSRESSFRFLASCSAYGTPGSVHPPHVPKCLQTITLKHGNTEARKGLLGKQNCFCVSVIPCFRVCCYFTSSSSTSNTSVAFGGITPPA